MPNRPRSGRRGIPDAERRNEEFDPAQSLYSMNIYDWLARYDIGLHDAEAHRLTIDYTRKTAEFDLEIWVPGDDGHGADKELYRPARLTFTGLEYCVIEPPDSRYRYDAAGTLCIDVDAVRDDDVTCPPARSDRAFRCRLFVNSWNSFIAICASSLEVIWLGETHDGPERPAEAPQVS